MENTRRQKTRKRLSILIICTMIMQLCAPASYGAVTYRTAETRKLITGFTDLPESVKNINVPLGADDATIKNLLAFPETVEATVIEEDLTATKSNATTSNADTASGSDAAKASDSNTYTADEEEDETADGVLVNDIEVLMDVPVTWELNTDPDKSVKDTFDAGQTPESYFGLDEEGNVNYAGASEEKMAAWVDMTGAYYTYTAVLPEKDEDGNPIVLAEGVEVPEIMVIVGESNMMMAAMNAIDISDKYVIIDKNNLSTYNNKTVTGKKTGITTDSMKLSNTVVPAWIVVKSGVTLNLTIEDLDIEFSDSARLSGIQVESGAYLNLTIKGENTLIGTYGGCGINVPEGANLRITSDSTGTLTAKGGNYYGGGAGIGALGNKWNTNSDTTETQTCGTINIEGGTINATGGTTYTGGSTVGGAAGIGGSMSGGTTAQTGKISITGGTVNATGGGYAAGIGGGYNGNTQEIRISGGTVTTTGSNGGAAIGSGYYYSTTTGKTLSCGTISITGGNVTANGNIGYGGINGSGSFTGGEVIIGNQASLTCTGTIAPADSSTTSYTISMTVYDDSLTGTSDATLTVDGIAYDATSKVSTSGIGTITGKFVKNTALSGQKTVTLKVGSKIWTTDIDFAANQTSYSTTIGKRYTYNATIYSNVITADRNGVTVTVNGKDYTGLKITKSGTDKGTISGSFATSEALSGTGTITIKSGSDTWNETLNYVENQYSYSMTIGKYYSYNVTIHDASLTGNRTDAAVTVNGKKYTGLKITKTGTDQGTISGSFATEAVKTGTATIAIESGTDTWNGTWDYVSNQYNYSLTIGKSYSYDLTIYDGRLTQTLTNATVTVNGNTYNNQTINVSEKYTGTISGIFAANTELNGTGNITVKVDDIQWSGTWTYAAEQYQYSSTIGKKLYLVTLKFYAAAITTDLTATLAVKQGNTALSAQDGTLVCDNKIVKQSDGHGIMTAYMPVGVDNTTLEVVCENLNNGNKMTLADKSIEARTAGNTFIMLSGNQQDLVMDLAKGSITIEDQSNLLKFTYYDNTGQEKTVTGQYYTNSFKIMQSNNGTSTSNTINVKNTTQPLNLTLSGINIAADAATTQKLIDIGSSGNANVVMTLEGMNKLQRNNAKNDDDTAAEGYAVAVHVPYGSALTVEGGEGDTLDTGSDAYYGIAIGGSKREACGTITINGGNVIAKSYRGCAIGNGYGNTGTSKTGKIVINGGTVNADHTYPVIQCSAIGGYTGSSVDVTINGGTVIATAKQGGAIGLENGSVKITGGTIHTSSNGATSFVKSPTTNDSRSVYYTTLNLGSSYKNNYATDLNIIVTGYNLTDAKTDANGVLHVYLPVGEQTAYVDGQEYLCTVASSGTNTFVKGKTQVTISASAANEAYDGDAHAGFNPDQVTFDTNWDGTVDNLDKTYYKGSTVAGTALSGAPADVGTYTVRLAIPSSYTGYKGYKDVTFTIDQADQQPLTIVNVPNRITYGDGSFTVSTTGGSTSGTVTWSIKSGSTYASIDNSGKVTVKGAGSVTISATMEGNNNYKSVTTETTFTIAGLTLEAGLFTAIPTQYFTNSQIKPSVSTTLSTDDYQVIGYGENTTVGRGSVVVEGKGNYQGQVTLTFAIAYIDAPTILYNGTAQKTWYKEAVEVSAAGYTVSDSLTGSYDNSYTIDSNSDQEVSKTLYFKKNNTDYITNGQTVKIGFDKTPPTTGEVSISSKSWDSFLTGITFGRYQANHKTVTIKGSDATSGVRDKTAIENGITVGSTISYCIVEGDEDKQYSSVDEFKAAEIAGKIRWNPYESGSKLEVSTSKKLVVYAKIADLAGNCIYRSSGGVLIDNTAPVISGYAVSSTEGEITDNSAVFKFTVDEAGNYYYVVLPASTDAPTAKDIIATVDKTALGAEGGTAIAGAVKYGSGSCTAGSPVKEMATELSFHTAYKIYIAATDIPMPNIDRATLTQAVNTSDVAVIDSFTTAKKSLEDAVVTLTDETGGSYGGGNYTGTSHTPKVNVTLDGQSLAADQYEVVYTNSNTTVADKLTVYAGDVTVTIQAKDNGNYIGSTVGKEAGVKTYTIAPKPVTAEVIADGKVYDGTITATIKSQTIPTEISGESLKLTGITGTFVDATVGTGKTVKLVSTGAKVEAEAGTNTVVSNYSVTYPTETTADITQATAEITIAEGKTSVTKTFKDPEFSLEGISKTGDGTLTYTVTESKNAAGTDVAMNKVITVSADGKVTIAGAGKATITVSMAATRNYKAAENKTITVIVNKNTLEAGAEDRSYIYAAGSGENAVQINVAEAGKLPTDRGATSYRLDITKVTDADGILVAGSYSVNVEGVLTYKVKAVGETLADSKATATIPVTVTMENYKGQVAEQYTYTLTIHIVDKTEVALQSGSTVTVSGSNVLTYGEALSKLTFNSVVFVEQGTDTVVEGTIAWTDGTTEPNAGTTTASWTFTPTDFNVYKTVTGSTGIQVNKAQGTVANLEGTSGYQTTYTFTGKEIAAPASTNFTTNSGSTEFTYTWYKDSVAGGNKLEDGTRPLAVGNYILKVDVKETSNYTSAFTTLKVTVGSFEPNPKVEATLAATNLGTDNWYHGDVTVLAPSGYRISREQAENSFTDPGTSFVVSVDQNKEITYYLMQNGTGYITEAMTITVKRDTTVPTAKITVKEKWWDSFLETVSFGIYTNKVDTVTIDAADSNGTTKSGINTVEYYICSTSYAGKGGLDSLKVLGDSIWSSYDSDSKPQIAQTATSYIYARVTDKAGNTAYVSTDGIVQDTTKPELAVTPTGTEYTDLNSTAGTYTGTVTVTITASDSAVENQSTLSTLKYTLDNEAETEIASGGQITITEKGRHTISAKAVDKAGNEESKAVTIYIFGSAPVVTITPEASIIYDGAVIAEGTDFTLNRGGSAGAVSYFYKVQNTADDTYISGLPTDAGYYTIKAVVAEDGTGFYQQGVTTADLTIGKAAGKAESDSRNYIYAVGSGKDAVEIPVPEKVTLPENRGTTSFALGTVTDPDNILTAGTCSVDTSTGLLSYKVAAADVVKLGKTAKIPVVITMANYQDFVYTLTITSTDKKTVALRDGSTVTVKAGEKLTYGDMLSALTFAGAEFVEAGTDTRVEGKLDWVDGSIKPAAAVKSADWSFTPENTDTYKTVSGTTAIQVDKAAATVENAAEDGYVTEYIYTGKEIASPADADFTTNSEPASYTYTWYKKSVAEENKLAGTARPLEVGTYVLKVDVEENDNYTSAAVDVNVEIKTFAPAVKAMLADTNVGANGWYTGDVTLLAPEGYTISREQAVESFASADSSLAIQEDQNGDFTYYLKQNGTEYITEAMEILVKRDTELPTAGINVKETWWRSFLETVTFGLYTSELDAVTIEAEDETGTANSGIDTVEYLISSTPYEGDAGLNNLKALDDSDWSSYSSINKPKVEKNTMNYVYARVTDKAGNRSYVSTDGIIEDITAPDVVITPSGTAYDDAAHTANTYIGTVTVKVEASDFAVAGQSSLDHITYQLDEGSETSITSGSQFDITERGRHTVVAKAVDEAGHETSETLTLYIYDGEYDIAITPASSIVYDGEMLEEGNDFKLDQGESQGTVTYSHKIKGTEESSYTAGLPVDAGSYTVKAVLAEDSARYYPAVEQTADIIIKKAAAPSITFPTAESIYSDQKLSSSTLTGGSTEYGTFAWTDGSILPTVENSGYEVTFTPSEGTKKNYEALEVSELTAVVAVKVMKRPEKNNTKTDVAVAPAAVEEAPAGASEEVKEIVEALKSPATAPKAEGLDAAADSVIGTDETGQVTVQTGNTVVTGTQAVEALEKENIATAGKETKLVVEPYIQVKVQDIVKEGDKTVLVMDIKAMYNVKATTAASTKDMVEAGTEAAENQAVNTVTIGTGYQQEVSEPVTLSIPLPKNFVKENLFIRHTHGGTVSYYEVTVDGDMATFVNEHGFSKFELLSDTQTGTLVFDSGVADVTYNLANVGDELPVAVKDGYTFQGWNINGTTYTTFTLELLELLNGTDGKKLEVTAVFTKNSSGSSGGSSGGSGNSDSSSHASGWSNEGAKGWRYYDTNGTYARNAWRQVNENGTMVWYHFGADGYMNTGWFLDTDGSWYYLNPVSDGTKGAMKTGWLTDALDGHRYYLDPKSGKMAVGWVLIDGVWYYFNDVAPAASGWYFDQTKNLWAYDPKTQTPLGALVEGAKK